MTKPDPALGFADDRHAALGFEHGPEFHYPAQQDEAGPEEGEHEDGVDGVVAVEDLAEDDAAVGGAREPFAVVVAGADPPDNQPEHRRNGEEDGQARGLAHPLAHDGRRGEVFIDHVAGRGHHVRWLGAARAEVRAVAAVVAEPEVHIGAQLVPEAPGGPDHFLARIGRIGRGKRAGHGTGSALEAFLEGFAPRFRELPGKLKIRFKRTLCHCCHPPTCP